MSSERAAGGVHRLVDMVVEEVSLVDRAANKRRFLVVKRDRIMAAKKTKPEEARTEGEAEDPSKKADADSVVKAEEALAVATEALEALTLAVERLGDLEAADAVPVVESLIGELTEAVTELKAVLGTYTEEAEPTEASAEKQEPAATIAEVRELLGKIREVIASATKKSEPEQPASESSAPPPPAPADAIAEQLGAINASLQKLETAVKDQAGRIARLEKGVGFPNSRSAPEQSPPRQQEVGWPLDLNKPRDRDSVDKSTSFHER